MITNPRVSARCLTREGEYAEELQVDHLVVAGWTGRDSRAVSAHMAELQALGVKTPPQFPVFYEIDCCLLTTAPIISVVGADSTGEAEAVVVVDRSGTWVTVGSDHTDRALETISVTKSKQACRKPIGTTFWLLKDIEGHWDRIELRSFVLDRGRRELYQEGLLSHNVRPAELMTALESQNGPLLGTALFCGTQPARGSIRAGEGFEIELVDPVMGRSIKHTYRVRALEDLG